ncbi:radical SAM protein [Mucisphaera calidilacus]|uniref:Aminodeoxyfutalosine synthase n=1 Tax=Mucisphaera calidilacus TaxID=2527982 RepID=A0A518BZ71_9BACT|nr:radical SAM protein [Mucisphaera calidilacus]QDU72271.1 Aminodeoxyfutalosine synthase [Mucisphaera calidilacus]
MTERNPHLGDELGIEAVIAGERRLSRADAMRLYHEAELTELGRWASAVCDRIHGPMRAEDGSRGVRTYVIDRNINYTNVCSAHCTFCAFRRDEGEDDSYTLTTEQLHEKVRELVEIGGTQVLLQGGMHPGLELGFYEDLLRGLKRAFPQVHIHGFSPPEFVEFVAVLELEGFPTTEPKRSHELPAGVWSAKLEAVMRRLMDAGLDSIPGGGGEIFAEHVRRRIGLGKATADQWLDVMSMAHRLGMKTSATMMFGHIEGVADRIDHMARVRERQDLAIENDWPGRYVSFIAWPFQRENTPLGRLPDFDRESGEAFAGDVLADLVASGSLDGGDKRACDAAVPGAGKVVRQSGASDYLRTQAIARLFLDNVHSIGSSWVTMGPKIGQIALFYGANDLGSVMMEENVVSAAGTTYCLTEPYLCHLIREAGFVPAQRDNYYNLLRVHGGGDGDAPDLRVTDWSTQREKKLHVEGVGSPRKASAETAVRLTIGEG